MTFLKQLLGGVAAVVGCALSPCGQAAVYTYNFASNGGGGYQTSWCGSQVIPDNTAAGVAYALDFGASGERVQDIRLSLNITGGWNGDLYAYLSHGNGYAVLLNRPGASASNPDGFSTSGLNVVLTTSTAVSTDIHNVANPVDGASYQADGRLSFTDATRDHTLDVFNHMEAGGSWTLFFADRAGGDVSTLAGWSLEITTAPEPVNLALGVFGVVLVTWQGGQWWRSRGK